MSYEVNVVNGEETEYKYARVKRLWIEDKWASSLGHLNKAPLSTVRLEGRASGLRNRGLIVWRCICHHICVSSKTHFQERFQRTLLEIWIAQTQNKEFSPVNIFCRCGSLLTDWSSSQSYWFCRVNLSPLWRTSHPWYRCKDTLSFAVKSL